MDLKYLLNLGPSNIKLEKSGRYGLAVDSTNAVKITAYF